PTRCRGRIVGNAAEMVQVVACALIIVDRHTTLLSLDDDPPPQIAGYGECSVAAHRPHLIRLIARLGYFSCNFGDVELFENDNTSPLGNLLGGFPIGVGAPIDGF